MKEKCALILISLLLWSLPGSFLVQCDGGNEEGNNIQSNSTPLEEITLRVDLVFAGYNETQIDLSLLEGSLLSSYIWYGVDYIWNEATQQYDSLLDLRANIDWHFHFASQDYSNALDDFVDNSSWLATTSALNTTALNLQEETGNRMSIFCPQNGTAINGTAVEGYLASHNAFTVEEPSYTIHLLNFSRFDSEDHLQEHWFEVDEIDPDSNQTASWWRLEWDNDLNPDVEYPYPAWGYRNRLYFIDPYCHQWYTRWTDIWWNPEQDEGHYDYRLVDLDSYLAPYSPGTSVYKEQLATYLSGWLNDIVFDVAGRGDGLWADEKSISSQVLMLNDALSHGYTHEELEWIIHEEVVKEEIEYIITPDIANISIETTWANLPDFPELLTILTEYTLGAAELDQCPWYRSDWTYLDGFAIFYEFLPLRETYFDLTLADSTFTSWILLMQNVSMVAYTADGWKEFTAIGGDGNVVSFKDLNRYFASDGVTPRSGLTGYLVHEIGHVLGFLHAEAISDLAQGAGGFMRDTMSYYTEGSSCFSVFLRDSFYRTSSIIARQRTSETIELYRNDPYHDVEMLAAIEEALADGEAALAEMNYLEAFLAYRQLYEYTENLEYETPSPSSSKTIELSTLIIILPFCVLAIWYRKRHRRS